MPEKQADRKIVTTRREVAELFEVQLKTVDYWQQQWRKTIPDCPCATHHYDVVWIARWIMTRPSIPAKVKKRSSEILGVPFAQSRVLPADGDGSGTNTLDLRSALLQEQVRHEREKAEAAARKNRIAEQDLVSLSDVKRLFSDWFAYIRTLLQRLPNELQPGLPEPHRAQILSEVDQRVNLMLRAIYDRGAQVENIKSVED